MNTTEVINGQSRLIEWDWINVYERHDNNWCCWHVEGIDQQGNKYIATCQGDANNPDNFHSDIEDIELNNP